VTLNAHARRLVLLALATICLVWTVGMPVLAKAIYPSPEQQPHGAAKYVFYCHVI
jgi:hypothetical protein